MNDLTNIEDKQVQKAAHEIISEGFKAAGIKSGDEFAALAKLLKARKMTVDKFGEEHWEDDNTAIRGGVELVLKLRRLLDTKVDVDIKQTTTYNFTSADIPILANISNEIKLLAERQQADATQQGRILEAEFSPVSKNSQPTLIQ